MAIAKQSGNDWSNNVFTFVGTATSLAGTLAASVAEGSLIVVISQIYGDEEATFSDDKSNTWSTVTPRAFNGPMSMSVQMGYTVVGAGKGGTIQVTVASATSTNRGFSCAVYTGNAPSSVVDGTPVKGDNNTGSATTVDPGSVTTTGGALVLSCGVSSVTGALTEGSGYTTQSITSPSFTGIYANGTVGTWDIQEKITSAAATEATAFSSGTAKSYWSAIAAAFKEAAAPVNFAQFRTLPNVNRLL